MWPIILFLVAQWISSYSGPIKNMRHRTCDPNPCLNGGNCTRGVDSFYCICPEYTFGWRCNNFGKYGNVKVRFIGEDPNITISYHGRLEVKIGNGEWGAVCAKNPSFENQLPIAKVVCKQFGDKVAKDYRASEELALKGKVVLESLTCNGYELSLDECSSIPGNKCAGDRITFACFRRTQLELRPVPSN